MSMNSGISRPPVMEDVAKLASVSHQTVSRVLNAHPNVRKATRERVEKAIAELGYRPNTAARSLITRRSQTIGVLGSDLSYFGPANTLLGVQQAARGLGYFVSMASLDEVTPAAIRDALEYFMTQSVDGIVVIVAHKAMFESLRTTSLSVPLVAVGFGVDEGLSIAAVDQRLGASLAVQHLTDLGHKTIAHISGPEEWIDATARIDGWRCTLAQSGLPDSVLVRGDWSAESGYRAGLDLVSADNVTAVFAANDQMALGALRAFSEVGLRVPLDISVVGYDDQPEAAYFSPPLTTVNQGFKDLGARCIQKLLSEIAGGHVGEDSVAIPVLVTRSSTSSPFQRRSNPASA
ncbi:LacI family DNA-binding transcriptional regulator [Arthrobacter sp. NPDC056727]|uniref:LacI family DNA-binding transcriptional regulator n=1 Tax=Arthrobacter sp. NPDC056727 TaxID=3345927 RepID=UPI0036726CE8